MWRIVRYQGAYALQQVLTGKIEATGFPTARHAEAKRREAYRDAGITATSSGGGGLEPHDAAYHLNPIGSHTYLTDKGTTSHADLDTHVGAEAPHSGHEKTANKGAASGYAELNASALVPSDQLGTSGSTGKFLKYPNEWADAPGTGDWTDMDDVPDGTTYVKTENNLTDAGLLRLMAGQFVNNGRIQRDSDSQLSWTGTHIGIYDPTAGEWKIVVPSSTPTLSNSANDLDSSALTHSVPYDIFAEWSSATAFTLVAKKWTNDTTRAVTPALWEGIYCYDNSTDNGKKRRWLGTIRLKNDSGAKFTWSETQRWVSNLYNKSPAEFYCTANASGGTVTDNSYALWTNWTSPGISIVLAQSQDITITGTATGTNDASGYRLEFSIAIDGTAGGLSGQTGSGASVTGLARTPLYGASLSAGYHYVDIHRRRLVSGSGSPTHYAAAIVGTVWM